MAVTDPTAAVPAPSPRTAPAPRTLEAASAPEPAPSALDAVLGSLRLHHAIAAAVVLLAGALALAAPALTVLPAYLALVALEPVGRLQRRFDLSFAAAAAIVVFGAFFVILASALTIVLPLALQALRFDPSVFEAAPPAMEAALAWARGAAAELGVDLDALAAEIDVESEIRDLVIGEGASTALALGRALIAPLVWLAMILLVVFMASYALGYAHKLRAEIRRFLRVLFPTRTAVIAERLAHHAQRAGAAVFRGYSAMVVVLGGFYFLSYLGAVAFFTEARDLPPAIVVGLVVLTALIGAVPGLGAKLLLALGAIAGFAVGAVTFFVTGSIGLGIYIFVAVLIVTGFESKFGTPSTLGRALGVNSCVMLFLAIATVAAFGVTATLWTIFVILPILVAGVRTLVEMDGEPQV